MTKTYDKPEIKLLRFKWTVSKARDTYGYNICSLYAAGVKVASCNGGGYDMQGTALAEYLAEQFQPQLLAIKDQAYTVWKRASDKPEDGYDSKNNEDGLYGMSLEKRPEGDKVELDGACGQTSIERIAEAAGIELTSAQTDKDKWGYFLTMPSS